MTFKKGMLIEHTRRPEWGTGMVVATEITDNGHRRYEVLYQDGGRRKSTAEFLREIEATDTAAAVTLGDDGIAPVDTPVPAAATRSPRCLLVIMGAEKDRRCVRPFGHEGPHEFARPKTTDSRQVKSYRAARAHRTCPQCGGGNDGDKWACKACRTRHNAQKRERRGPGKSARWSAKELRTLDENLGCDLETLTKMLAPRTLEAVRIKRDRRRAALRSRSTAP